MAMTTAQADAHAVDETFAPRGRDGQDVLFIEMLDLQIDERPLSIEVLADRGPEQRIMMGRVEGESDPDGIGNTAFGFFFFLLGTECGANALSLRHNASLHRMTGSSDGVRYGVPLS